MYVHIDEFSNFFQKMDSFEFFNETHLFEIFFPNSILKKTLIRQPLLDNILNIYGNVEGLKLKPNLKYLQFRLKE